MLVIYQTLIILVVSVIYRDEYLLLGEGSQAAAEQQLLICLQAKSHHPHPGAAITYKAKGHCISKEIQGWNARCLLKWVRDYLRPTKQ